MNALTSASLVARSPRKAIWEREGVEAQNHNGAAPMTAEKPFKPSIPFLRKVEAGQVYNAFGYTIRRGGYYTTKGGESAIRNHANAGYITRPGTADLGRPSYAKLTEVGRALLDAQKDPA